jgi:hypothetical protein
MRSAVKDTVGCLGAVAGLFLFVGLLVNSCGGPQTPPMSAAEMQSRIAKIKVDRTQRCIDNINNGYRYWPKDMQKYAGPAMAKCADHD